MTRVRDPIYLDYNATTPMLEQVVDAMLPYLKTHFGNPSSGHEYGWRALDAVERARSQVAELIGASSEEVVFTSGGTEANNMAIRGVVTAAAVADRRHVVTTVIEHPATVEPLRHLEDRGHEISWVEVDRTGRVNAEAVSACIRNDTALVTVMHANNEVGTLQPITDIARAAHERGAVMHTDAAQSLGKVEVAVDRLGVDLLSLAGHKLYAPKGIGALYIRSGVEVAPVLRGAGQERGRRPGTENVAFIVGLGQACEIALATLEAEAGRVRALRDELHRRLEAEIPGLALNGHPEERLPNTLNIRLPSVTGNAILGEALSVAASTGAACHEDVEEPSAVILAMGVDPAAALGSVRLTLGRGSTSDHVAEAAGALVAAWKKLAG
jgi:cysteine desulfurase